MKSLTQILDKTETEFYKGIIMNDRAKQIMTEFVWTSVLAIAFCVGMILIGAWLVR
jgi:hypothetical protein